MELVVFDLDGTLLNSDKKLSDVTINVLNQLKEKGIAYTIATGRTRLSALPCIENHAFPHTQIFKNGVEWWDPIEKKYRHDHFLYRPQVTNVLAEFEAISVTPFVFCLENDGGHTVYYGNIHNDINRKVLEEIDQQPGLTMLPLHTLSDTTQITNISALAKKSAVE
jgi:5-amino-6-(5-phospho-D-ribitylamino)uracil phosphatase